jgi:hypothetical protein
MHLSRGEAGHDNQIIGGNGWQRLQTVQLQPLIGCSLRNHRAMLDAILRSERIRLEEGLQGASKVEDFTSIEINKDYATAPQ